MTEDTKDTIARERLAIEAERRAENARHTEAHMRLAAREKAMQLRCPHDETVTRWALSMAAVWTECVRCGKVVSQ